MNASRIRFRRAAMVGAGLLLASARGAAAQPPEAAAITSCLCLHRALATLSDDMKAKTAALDAAQRDLAGLDAELAREKPKVDVDDPASVDRYKALLQRRDAAYRRSIGAIQAAAAAAVARYNRRAEEYNRDCAGRPFSADMTRSVEASLVCPPLP